MDFSSMAKYAGASSLIDFGKDVFDKAVSYYQNKNTARQAQANTRKNMQEQQELQLQGQFQSIANSASALRAAGLNPALAASGHFSAAPTVSATPAPMANPGQYHGSHDFANNLMAMTQADLAKSQTELNEAAADKAKAEASQTELENKHALSQDNALKDFARDFIAEMRDTTDNDFIGGVLDTYLENNPNIDIGSFQAFNETFFGLSQRERDRERNFLQTELDKKVLQMQYDSDAAQALADMPRAKRFEIYANVLQLNALVARLNSETSLTEDRRNELRAKIGKLGQETESILHHDPAAMYKQGDISSLLVGAAYDAVKAAGAGAGFALGSKVAGRAAPSVSPKTALPPKIGSGTLGKKSAEMPSSQLERIQRRARQISDDPVRQAQYIDKAVRNWKASH